MGPKTRPAPPARGPVPAKGHKKMPLIPNFKALKASIEALARGASGVSPPITIPHGFQLVKKIPALRPPRVVVYDAVNAAFASVDLKAVNLFREDRHAKIQLSNNVVCLVFSKRHRLFIGYTLDMRVKIFSDTFDVLYDAATPKAMLSLGLDEANDEVIMAGVGTVSFWKIVVAKSKDFRYQLPKNSRSLLPTRPRSEEFSLQCRLTIDHTLPMDSLLSTMHVDPGEGKLYVAVDTTVYVFSCADGSKIEVLKDRHENSLTCIARVPSHEYMLTASTDGTVRAWNATGSLVHTFAGHSSAVTGMVLFPAELKFVTCSTDGTLRMWDLETFEEAYRLEVQEEMTGMGIIDGAHFYVFSPAGIQIWNNNQYLHPFTTLRSDLTLLRRVEADDAKPARVLSLSADGSVRIVSPVTGAILCIAFPVVETTPLVDIVLASREERLYALLANGDIYVFSTTTNPCQLKEVIRMSESRSDTACTCIAFSRVPTDEDETSTVPSRGATPAAHSPAPSIPSLDSEEGEGGVGAPKKSAAVPQAVAAAGDPILFGGRRTGQIVVISIEEKGAVKLCVQGHAKGVNSLVVSADHKRLVSLGDDSVARVWQVARPGPEQRHAAPVTFLGGPAPVPPPVLLTSERSIRCESQPLTGCYLGSLLCAIHKDRSLVYYPLDDSDSPPIRHSVDEDHTEDINSIAACPALGLVLTSSDDSSLKVWDVDNSLVREIQLGQAIKAACFVSKRGDIILSTGGNIALARVTDYLPLRQLSALADPGVTIEDDAIEEPIAFDAHIEVWKFDASFKPSTSRSASAADGATGPLSEVSSSTDNDFAAGARKKARDVEQKMQRRKKEAAAEKDTRESKLQRKRKSVRMRAGMDLLRHIGVSLPSKKDEESDSSDDDVSVDGALAEADSASLLPQEDAGPVTGGGWPSKLEEELVQKLMEGSMLARMEKHPVAPDGIIPNSIVLRLFKKTLAAKPAEQRWRPRPVRGMPPAPPPVDDFDAEAITEWASDEEPAPPPEPVPVAVPEPPPPEPKPPPRQPVFKVLPPPVKPPPPPPPPREPTPPPPREPTPVREPTPEPPREPTPTPPPRDPTPEPPREPTPEPPPREPTPVVAESPEPEDLPAVIKEVVGLAWFPSMPRVRRTVDGVLDQLVSLLSTGEWTIRRSACEALGRIHAEMGIPEASTRAIPAVIPLVSHHKWELRMQACRTLGQMGIRTDGAIAALISRLVDEVAEVGDQARHALFVLAGIRDKESLRREMVRLGLMHDDGVGNDREVLLELREKAFAEHERALMHSLLPVTAPTQRVANRLRGWLVTVQNSYVPEGPEERSSLRRRTAPTDALPGIGKVEKKGKLSHAGSMTLSHSSLHRSSARVSQHHRGGGGGVVIRVRQVVRRMDVLRMYVPTHEESRGFLPPIQHSLTERTVGGGGGARDEDEDPSASSRLVMTAYDIHAAL